MAMSHAPGYLFLFFRGPLGFALAHLDGALDSVAVYRSGVVRGELTVGGIAFDGEADLVAVDRSLERRLATRAFERALDLVARLFDGQGARLRPLPALAGHLPRAADLRCILGHCYQRH